MYEAERKLAEKAALQAGEMLRIQKQALVNSMEGKDIKLAVDKASEAIIIDALKESGLPILSEEQGLYNGTDECLYNGKIWIIDPLDGSANYWKNLRELTCVSIAMWENGKPVLGIVNRFVCNELFVGIVGQGAWLNDEPIRSSAVTEVSDAILATGFPLKRSYDSASLEKFVKQIQSFKKVRMLGAAALMGAFVSCGRVDAYMEESIMLWDIAAASAIVLAAGGVMEIQMQEEYKCICKLFANDALKMNTTSVL